MKIDWEKFKQPPNMIKMLAAQKNREFDDDDDDDENDDLDDEVLYNFWICHSDSTINRNVYEAIQHVEGVETLEPVTRYRFRVGIAKLFDEDEVKERIEKTMLSYIDPLNYLIGELKDKSCIGLLQNRMVYTLVYRPEIENSLKRFVARRM